MVDGASADLLAELLDAYDFELKSRAEQVWESFLPGLFRNEIQDGLDEFPFYSTVEGGPGASLVNIAAPDNQTQGRQLGQFYQACGLVGSDIASDSNRFLVIPNPVSPSVGICSIG